VTFHYVENVQDVWAFALTDEIVKNPLTLEVPQEDEKEKK
jgi:ATP-dependent Lon protease